MARKEKDPYAPPPMYHDRSGALVRIVIMAGLLGAAAWGYTWYTSQEQTALVPEAVEEQQLAQAPMLPETPPEAAPEAAPTPAPPPRAAAPVRRSAPAEPAPEPVPPPSTSSTPAAPTTPAPIPPVDVPPSG
jgi:hypothetical protein